MKRLFLIILCISFASVLTAQQDVKQTRRGNKQYEKGNFSEAEVLYKKALEKNPQNMKAGFNLGAAQYRQENWEEATTNFTGNALNYENDPQTKAEAFYNLGNTLMQQQKYQESVEAYKQSLRLNPTDEDARYNLAYAQQKLAQQQQDQQNQDQQQDQNQDKQDQKEQQQQNQDQQKDQQDKQDQQQDQQNQQQQDSQQQDAQDQKQQPQQQQQISKEDAEKMLEAMKNKEQNTMDKVKQQQVGKGKKMDKDW